MFLLLCAPAQISIVLDGPIAGPKWMTEGGGLCSAAAAPTHKPAGQPSAKKGTKTYLTSLLFRLAPPSVVPCSSFGIPRGRKL